VDGNPLCTATDEQNTPVSVSDGAGGAIIAWQDNRVPTDVHIYVQRVGPYGAVLWTANGVQLCSAVGGEDQPTIAADGSGGAVIAWRDFRAGTDQNDIYAQRVNASGVVQWSANGVAVCTATKIQDFPSIAGDGSGGAIVAWSDNRSGGAFPFVYAARVDAAGSTPWTANGVQVCSQPSNLPHVVTDGAGGAIIAWDDQRVFSAGDVYAQRVNSAGTALWTADGVGVCVATNIQRTVSAAADGSGGVLLVWTDFRNMGQIEIYGQRLNSSGTAMWLADGVRLTVGGTADLPVVTSDGSGGMIAAWQSDSGGQNDIFARRVNSAGTALWTLGGASVCTNTADQTVPQVVSDNLGGAIFVWQDLRGGTTPDIYAQRLNATGVRQWVLNGVAICTAANDQRIPTMVSDGGNGAFMAWEDLRTSGTTGRDIYASRVGARGLVPTGVNGATPSAAFALSNAHPNPFSGDTSMDIDLREPSDVKVDIVDVVGRHVRDFTLRNVSAGARHIDFDAIDARGKELPSGVYFCRVTAEGATETRKLVIAR
jgi:hypothetical protein